MEERRLLFAASVVPALPFYQPPTHRLQGDGEFFSPPAAGAASEITIEFLRSHAAQLGLSADDFAAPRIADAYTDSDTGVTHLYLRQTFDGLDIVNAVLNASVSAQGELIQVGSSFVQLPSRFSPAATLAAAAPVLTPEAGLLSLAPVLGLPSTATLQRAAASNLWNSSIVLAAPQLSLDAIPARLVYVATAAGLQKCWEYVLRPPSGGHWYDVMADASTGQLVQGSDWAHHDAAYHVVAAPADSPDPGGLSTATDPADLSSSPFGWHDTNGVPGAEFTDTRGNNVFAQEDIDGNDTGGTRPDGGAGLNFNAPIDFSADPATYTAASTINLFYWNNYLHDLLVHYGFTESAGNFQKTNYSGQGISGDPVQADSQDGSGTNNANFDAPPDGLSPRMQMFLWDSPATARSVTLDISGTQLPLSHGISTTFGAQSYDITAPVVAANPLQADSPLVNAGAVAGKIALIDRGGVDFTVKVKHAQNAGAVGAIVVNNIAGEGAFDMAGSDPSITIPAVLVSQEDGALMKSLTPGSFTVRLLRGAELPRRDAAFDSVVVAHEYAHGVSIRLTGGPSNSNALNAKQSGGMGEGWSDYFALAITQQPSDQPNTPMSVGSYVLGLPRNGGGLRRQPYALDKAVNPLTFQAYNDDPFQEVHNTGEIWASALWDLHWLLIQAHGYDADLSSGYSATGPGSAGNKLALQLVNDALKLQPANPSFIEARDAILQADQIRTGGANQALIWQAFARRGLGVDAATTDSSADSVVLSFAVPSDFPRVKSPTAALRPGESMVIQFDRPMDPASFSIDTDLVSFTGPGGDQRLKITGAVWTDGNRKLLLTTDASLPPGAYSLTIGPDLLDATGHLLDQDGDQTPGETPYDVVTMQVAVFDSLLVTTAADKLQAFDGANLSLREAIALAADHVGSDTITFAPAVTGPLVLTRGALQFVDATAPLTITGPANALIAISGDDQTQLAIVAKNATLTLERIALTHGSGLGTAGVLNNGHLTLRDSLVADNTSLDDDCSGITNRGVLVVSGCTFQNNEASALVNDGTTTVINSTFTGNKTFTSGAALAAIGGDLTCTNCTITLNQADSANLGFGGGGGLFVLSATTNVVLNNCIVSGNYSGTLSQKDEVNLSDGGLINAAASHNNLMGTHPGGIIGGQNGNRVNVLSIGLGTLDLHGGLTPNYSLLPSSPAIEAGNSALAVDELQQPLVRDQRGRLRIADRDANGVATVDIGAFEDQRIVVLNTNDSGAGSLRQAILDANASSGSDLIEVLLPSGLQIVSLALPLPEITDPVTIQLPSGVVLQPGAGDHLPWVATAPLALTGGGTLKLDGGVLQTAGLTIDTATGTALDLATGVLIDDYTDKESSFTALSQYLASGINLSATIWDGPGLKSSTARDDASGITGVGIIDNAQIGYDSIVNTHFGFGEPDSAPVPFQAVLVKYTYAGDADLNGLVDGDDLVSFLVGFSQHQHRWDTGDFDYSGQVDGDDLTSLLVAYANQGAPLAPAAATSGDLPLALAEPPASSPEVADSADPAWMLPISLAWASACGGAPFPESPGAAPESSSLHDLALAQETFSWHDTTVLPDEAQPNTNLPPVREADGVAANDDPLTHGRGDAQLESIRAAIFSELA